jgi:hypothetical protein
MTKKFLYRSGQTLRVSGSWDSQHFYRHPAHEGGKAVSPTQRTPLPPTQEIHLVLISVRGWFDPRVIVRLEGLRQWNIPITPSGLKDETFGLVAQCLNQLSHCVPTLVQQHTEHFVVAVKFQTHISKVPGSNSTQYLCFSGGYKVMPLIST